MTSEKDSGEFERIKDKLSVTLERDVTEKGSVLGKYRNTTKSYTIGHSERMQPRNK